MRRIIPVALILPALFALFSGGCTEEQATAPDDIDTSTGLTCLGCHASQDSLVANLPGEGRVIEPRGDG